MKRLDEAIPTVSSLSTVQINKLRPHCFTSQEQEPLLDQAGSKFILQRFVPALLDSMYALQPVEYEPPAPRVEFIDVLKETFARGDAVVMPLQSFRLAERGLLKFRENLACDIS